MNWQPIATAPKDGSSILLYFDGYNRCQVTGGYWDEGLNCWVAGGYMRKGKPPKHWMPAPPPPD